MKKKVIAAALSTMALSGAAVASEAPRSSPHESKAGAAAVSQAAPAEADLAALASTCDPNYILKHVELFANASKY